MITEPNPIQNEDVLFHFDDSEDPPGWFAVESSSHNPPQAGGGSQSTLSAAGFDPPQSQKTPNRMLQTHPTSAFHLQSSLPTNDGRSAQPLGEKRADGVPKSKNLLVSQPMLIRRTTSPTQHDLFALSLEPAFSLSSRSNSQSPSDFDPNNPLPMLSLSPSSFASASSTSADLLVQTPTDHVGAYTHPPPWIASQSSSETFSRNLKDKGKERSRDDGDSPPVLPPLGFSPPATIAPTSSDLWPQIGVSGPSKTPPSTPYDFGGTVDPLDGDHPTVADHGMEVDITESGSLFLHSTSSLQLQSSLPRRLLESPRALQRFIPPMSRQPYVPPHHIPSRRHSFSNESRFHHLRHSNSDVALTLGITPVQGTTKGRSKGRLGSVFRGRAPQTLGLGSGIARKLFSRRRTGEGSHSEPVSAGNSRPMTPPPSLATPFVPGIRLPPPASAATDSNNARRSRILDLDLPDASAVRMTSCFLPKCGLTISSESSPTLNPNSNPNPNPNPAANPTHTFSGPRGRVITTPDSPPTSPIPGTPPEFPQNLAALYADPVSIPAITAPPSEVTLLRAKGRSYSSPFPLATFGPISVSDIISTPQPDVFEPLRFDLDSGAEDGGASGTEEEKKAASFDELLPREVKLTIFAWLVRVHEMDHERLVNAGADGISAKTKSGSVKWTAHKAGIGRNKWVGRDKGIRELVKLGRVSSLLSLVCYWQKLIGLTGIKSLAGPGFRWPTLASARPIFVPSTPYSRVDNASQDRWCIYYLPQPHWSYQARARNTGFDRGTFTPLHRSFGYLASYPTNRDQPPWVFQPNHPTFAPSPSLFTSAREVERERTEGRYECHSARAVDFCTSDYAPQPVEVS